MTQIPIPPRYVRVAVTQFEPIWLDLSVCEWSKTGLIPRMLDSRISIMDMVAIPPVLDFKFSLMMDKYSRTLSVDFDLSIVYIKDSLRIDSPETGYIYTAAKEGNVAVVLGFSENWNHSLYISQAIIDHEGIIKLKRRKLKATHMERTVFGEASGSSLTNVVELAGIGRVGTLACLEHALPLLKYHSYCQRKSIHVSQWPPIWEYSGGPDLWYMSRDGSRTLSQAYAIESQSFVLHTTAVLSQDGIDRMNTSNGLVMNMPGGGTSAIFGPDGRKLSEDLPDTVEGFLYADLDLDEILKSRSFLNVCGHYSRPDLLTISVNDMERVLANSA
ncbi:uncharacterized protein EAF01_010473 [Botrytis porri]|uniref:uncharacterized protein n=1 Tax=Botrytis porri TaxID=87229 RepID=UPI001901F9FF|nr:uncharacterized protein EAF01_010473 [Botrytis porri]KAF7892393.1 hypothetical protein EAF01_010473 [Botrytis porri]